MEKAIQDFYRDDVSYCYGCGRLNKDGLQLKSYWDGEEAVCRYTPKPYHTAIPGYVYGGLIASIIDCHSTGAASAAAYQAENREMNTEPPLRFVTASLHVDYLRPTPIGEPLVVKAKIKEFNKRKVIVTSTLYAGEETCARGEVVVVKMPETWLRQQD
jgi:acyl-coenzyme A thioesterase PaaI-like protein